MVAQPSDSSCGPTCLDAIYRYYGHERPLSELIGEIPMLETGGTLGVNLGVHALRHGFSATLVTFNLNIFDPTWFGLDRTRFRAKLATQLEYRSSPKEQRAVYAYLEFLDLGGKIEMRDLSGQLLVGYLKQNAPIITGLSATFLYRCPREIPETGEDDDERGAPLGHFVVLAGYDRSRREYHVADPYEMNPWPHGNHYAVSADRLITSILLGILTYDANLLIIKPRK